MIPIPCEIGISSGIIGTFAKASRLLERRRYPCVQGTLPTYYSPVRHSVRFRCLPRTPFDLHALTTPPAFDLSQDQTLHFFIVVGYPPKIRFLEFFRDTFTSKKGCSYIRWLCSENVLRGTDHTKVRTTPRYLPGFGPGNRFVDPAFHNCRTNDTFSPRCTLFTCQRAKILPTWVKR